MHHDINPTVPICINMDKRKTRSKAWLHFTNKDENSATCNVYKKAGNTSDMLKQLSMQHSVKFQEHNLFDMLHIAATAWQAYCYKKELWILSAVLLYYYPSYIISIKGALYFSILKH